MKKFGVRLARAAAAVCAVALLLSATACGAREQEYEKYFDGFLGTSVGVYIRADATAFWEKNKLESCYSAIAAELKRLDAFFSTENPDSEVSRYNAMQSGECMDIFGDFEKVYLAAEKMNKSTSGAFNPFVKRLIDLWGFSAGYSAADYSPKAPFDRERENGGGFALPAEEYVKAFSDLAKFDSEIKGGKLYKRHAAAKVGENTFEQEMDLSGIVKGYAADRIRDVIVSFGYKSYFVSAGTSSMYLSSLSGQPFDLEITDPRAPRGGALCVVKAENCSVSTSGIYEASHFYMVGDYRAHHIIDASTGRPAQTDLLSATVIGGSGAEADALTTAAMVMGAERAANYLSAAGLEFVLVTNDGKVITNAGEDVELRAAGYELEKV